nr:ER membrane complex subunit 2 [Polyrhizophydium stewartii]
MTFDVAASREYLAELRAGTAGGESEHVASPAGAGGAGASARKHRGPSFYSPSHVLEVAEALLASHASSLPKTERFAITEQAFQAALDCGRFEVAEKHLSQLESAFPIAKSLRVQKLYGQLHEATGNTTKAFEVYNTALDQDEANMALWRRSIARFVSAGQRHEAIEALVGYVDRFMQDTEGWAMLAKLYADECKFEQAAFCLEELMALRPLSPHHRARYADVVASLGRLNLAVKYYAAALEVLPDFVRALYGLLVVTHTLLERSKQQPKSRQLAAPSATHDIEPVPIERLELLRALARERLQAVYESKAAAGAAGAPAEIHSIVKAWLHGRTDAL